MSNRLFQWQQFVGHTIAKAILVNATPPRYLCVRQFFAIPFKELIRSSVIGLLVFCCPTTIVWSIRSIHVRKSVQRGFWRSPAHVLEKCFIAIQPCVAHADSSSSIDFIAFVFWVVASCLGRLPSTIFNSEIAASISFTMGSGVLPVFLNEAAATLCESSMEIHAPDYFFIPTFAFTQPRAISANVIASFFNREATKFITNFHINSHSHYCVFWFEK